MSLLVAQSNLFRSARWGLGSFGMRFNSSVSKPQDDMNKFISGYLRNEPSKSTAAPAAGLDSSLKRSIYSSSPSKASTESVSNGKKTIRYVLYGKFTRNNTHVTLCSEYQRVGPGQKGIPEQQLFVEKLRAPQEIKIHCSSGRLGFKGTQQHEYEAGFQVSSRVFSLMEQKGLLDHKIEIVLRGFGKGRQAFETALLGKEGTKLRPLIERITDGTKEKFGGTKSPSHRRV
ncbi:translational machinery component, partial [Nadsonia fulvescens var. elongata DSM 6958]